jgi:hypothetical protein
MDSLTRTYRFTITVNVEPGHSTYDDAEWAADAAWGALVNEYGLRAIYSDLQDVETADLQ